MLGIFKSLLSYQMVTDQGRGESLRIRSYYHYMWELERETRVELATLCLGSRCSTTELLPLARHCT